MCDVGGGPAPGSHVTSAEDVTIAKALSIDGDETVQADGYESLPSVTRMTLPQTVEGKVEERGFLIHTPARPRVQGGLPVVFAFHGIGSPADMWVDLFGPLVGNSEFIGVYPEGLFESWNCGIEPSKADEAAFVGAVLSTFSRAVPDGQVDHTRIFAVGYSNGAALVQRLACECNYFRAIAVVAGPLFQGQRPNEAFPPVSVMQVSGMNDKLIPYNGGESKVKHVFEGAEESGQLWAKHNACDIEERAVCATTGNVRIVWSAGDGRSTRVLHHGIAGSGHSLRPELLQNKAWDPDNDLWTAAWRFLSEA